MQLRRVLLLFALVLGLSAVVSSLAPPPEDGSEPVPDDPPAVTTPSVGPQQAAETTVVRFEAPAPNSERAEVPTKRVRGGSSVQVEVSVEEPGEVVLDGLGLRQAAVPLAPARFELLAEPAGRYAVLFIPVSGDPRLVGRLRVGGDSPRPTASSGTERVK